jgi:transcriptional regulator with XRE-family HTH domain
MTVDPLAFGVLLRRWRERRRLTQTDLALAANSSTRHVSYLETGKSQPSRAMIARLAELLEVPLRERNALLLAAGFAPVYRETALDALDAAKAAMDRILRAHLPYPAFAVDRHWNVVLSNGALPQLYEGCSETLTAAPINAMRLMLHPEGMGSRILNFSAWRAHCLGILRQQIEARADPKLQALHAEIAAYPVPQFGGETAGFDEAERLATPFRITTRFGPLSFLSTVTIFGTASDITLAELALEMLFPADDQTIEIANLMELERADQPPALAKKAAASRL